MLLSGGTRAAGSGCACTGAGAAVGDQLLFSGGRGMAAAAVRQGGGGNSSLFVTNVSGLHGNSPVLIGLLEYFQVRSTHDRKALDTARL